MQKQTVTFTSYRDAKGMDGIDGEAKLSVTATRYPAEPDVGVPARIELTNVGGENIFAKLDDITDMLSDADEERIIGEAQEWLDDGDGR